MFPAGRNLTPTVVFRDEHENENKGECLKAAWLESLAAPIAAGLLAALFMDDILGWLFERLGPEGAHWLDALNGMVLMGLRFLSFIAVFLIAHRIFNRW